MNPRSELRAFVQQSGVTVKQLAAAMDVSRAYLYLLMDEGSTQVPSREVALAIEDLSGIPLSAWDAFYTATVRAA